MAACPTKAAFYRYGIELHDFTGASDCGICYTPLLTPTNIPAPVLLSQLAEMKAQISGTNVSAGDKVHASIREIKPGESSSTGRQRQIRYYQHTAVKIKSCGHIYGVNCLRQWLVHNRTCPMCRKELYPVPTVKDCRVDLENRQPILEEISLGITGFSEDQLHALDLSLLRSVWATIKQWNAFLDEKNAAKERAAQLVVDLEALQDRLKMLVLDESHTPERAQEVVLLVPRMIRLLRLLNCDAEADELSESIRSRTDGGSEVHGDQGGNE
ncbi:hypothetical protein BU23DRAFT_604916 [Bimuria novae-zelandiae CBS 107.79]|uniref:RING-type domain-containing protein n=1 Tax=Bimuria novae-zelandiae CBS 107.79 TaxID=1447943 RepID=A0A6A5UKD9_9PLEO|nr:hypothetical protein BU23DRAFT_604916 [Bimuria novae-zelandiae CBS 107.79]